ncbi:hypothetical protein [Paraburkholderia kururiensis]
MTPSWDTIHCGSGDGSHRCFAVYASTSESPGQSASPISRMSGLTPSA